MKKNLIFLILLTFIFSIATVSAANETDNIIQSNISVSGDSFNDIQNVVNLANENDTLILSGVYKCKNNHITVSKSLNFIGENNATLDANYISCIINITQDSRLTFNNINFINAKNSAINMYIPDLFSECRSKIIINNCTFINNEGTGEGAVYVYECIVNNSNFINNHAIGNSNDLSSWGGAIHANHCTVTQSNFINNTALTNGGAILSEYALISRCNFINNAAGWEGGAFEITDVSVIGSNFTHNTAGRYGGAIYSDSCDILSCNFNNNTSNNSGGAIKAYRLNAYNSIFTNNNALYAGAIYATNLKIDNTTFINNNEGAVISSQITIDFKTYYSKFISLDNSLNPNNFIKVTAQSIKTSYQSGENLKISFTTIPNNRHASYIESLIIIKKGKKNNYNYFTCDENGIYYYSVSKLSAGTYELQIVSNNADEYYTAPFPTKTIKVIITKAKTTVKAPKVTNKYKKSKFFKVSIKHI